MKMEAKERTRSYRAERTEGKTRAKGAESPTPWEDVIKC